MNPRMTSEGYLLFPHRGPPPELPGYEPIDNQHLYVLQPILYPCTLRERRKIDKFNKAKGTFCCKKQVNWCLKQNKIVLRLECKECKDRV